MYLYDSDAGCLLAISSSTTHQSFRSKVQRTRDVQLLMVRTTAMAMTVTIRRTMPMAISYEEDDADAR